MTGKDDVSTIQAWHQKARELLREGKNEKALEACGRALEISPHDPALYLCKASILARLGRLPEALAFAQKGAPLLNHVEGFVVLAGIYSQMNRMEEASATLMKAQRMDEKHPQVWLLDGVLRHKQGSPEDAIRSYDRAISLQPDLADAWLNKGIALSVLNEFESAVACYDQAISRDPACRKAYSNKAICLQILGREEEAAKCLASARIGA